MLRLRPAALLLLGALAALPACAGSRFRVGMSMPEENRAVVEVLGDTPEVVIQNTGDGVLLVSWEPLEGEAVAAQARRLQPGEKLARKMPGPTTVYVWTEDEGSEAVVVAFEASGLSVISAPKPRD